MNKNPSITIKVQTQFLKADSIPAKRRFIFTYTITITNDSKIAVQLINRHWHIVDNNNNVQEVTGEGVVGKQPHLAQGESFKYTSGAILETSAGTMEGYYEFMTSEQELFKAAIPTFSLIDPSQLH